MSGRTHPFSRGRVWEPVPRSRHPQDPEDERPTSLARGEGSREAPGAEGREAAWSSRLRVSQEELAALPGKLHGEEQEKEHLLLQLHGQPSPFPCSDGKQKPYDYTAPSTRKARIKDLQEEMIEGKTRCGEGETEDPEDESEAAKEPVLIKKNPHKKKPKKRRRQNGWKRTNRQRTPWRRLLLQK